jgi:hypothetical protein
VYCWRNHGCTLCYFARVFDYSKQPSLRSLNLVKLVGFGLVFRANHFVTGVLPPGRSYRTETMNVACVIFSIPDAIFRGVLLNWLSLREVVMLDSSICHYLQRKHFELLVYGKQIVFSLQKYIHRTNLLNSLQAWAGLRGAQIDSLMVAHQLVNHPEYRDALLDVTGSSIRFIQCTDPAAGASVNSTVLSDVGLRCPNVENVSVQFSPYVTQGSFDNALRVLFQSCSKLSTLSLKDVVVTGEGLAEALKHCRCLTHFTCCGISIAIPTEVAVPSLEYFDVTAYVSDTVLVAMGQRCPKLRCMKGFVCSGYSGSPTLSDVGVRALLQGCPLLRETDAEYAVGVSTELRVELARRGNLTALDLYDVWRDVDNALAVPLLAVCPLLVHLDCHSCGWVTDATLAACAQHCPLLTSINLSACNTLTIDGVAQLLSAVGATLRSIELFRCPNLGDQAVLAAAQHCPALQMFSCPLQVTDAAVTRLAVCCPKLVIVSLSYTDVTDSSLAALAAHCPGLGSLQLTRCTRITLAGLRSLAEHGASADLMLTLPDGIAGDRLPIVAAGDLASGAW